MVIFFAWFFMIKFSWFCMIFGLSHFWSCKWHSWSNLESIKARVQLQYPYFGSPFEIFAKYWLLSELLNFKKDGDGFAVFRHKFYTVPCSLNHKSDWLTDSIHPSWLPSSLLPFIFVAFKTFSLVLKLRDFCI